MSRDFFVHPSVILLGYFAATLFAGSLLAYPIHLLDVALGMNYGYEKVLSRSIVLASVVLLWPAIRYLETGLEAVGLAPWSIASIWRGALLGTAVVLPVAMLIFALELRVLDPRVSISPGYTAALVLGGAVAGLVVGFVEELIFRGLVFSLLRNWLHIFGAAVSTSLLYALVHFLDVPNGFSVAEAGWFSGFGYLWTAFAALAGPAEYWDSFVALFLLGLALNWVRVRGNLFWCVGIHAGFVMVVHVVKGLSVRSVINPYDGLVGSYDHFTGHMVSIWLIMVAVIVALWLRRRTAAAAEMAG
ncbi:MAG: CPBP family intramembrane metalloprotease [Gammaproteobacteria bacterium]|nr:CPBP family intramembrane metalloprotease [Gammaproteobacteria bacterium]